MKIHIVLKAWPQLFSFIQVTCHSQWIIHGTIFVSPFMIPINPIILCHWKLWHLKDKLWKAARRSLSEKDVWCSGSFGTGLKFCTCPPINRLGLLHVSSTWISADFSDWVAHKTQGTWPCVTLKVKSVGEHNFCLFLWNIHGEALNCHIRNLLMSPMLWGHHKPPWRDHTEKSWDHMKGEPGQLPNAQTPLQLPQHPSPAAPPPAPMDDSLRHTHSLKPFLKNWPTETWIDRKWMLF